MHDRPDGRLVHAEVAGYLTRAGGFLGVEHESQDEEPLFERDVRPVKDRPHRHGKGPVALMALPAPDRPVFALVDAGAFALAVVARGLIIPPYALKVFDRLEIGLEGFK